MQSPSPARRVVAGFAIFAVLTVLAIVGSTPEAGAETANGRMMLVMDSSGSMKEKLPGGDTKIKAAKSALNTVIDGLPEQQSVGLRVYGAKVFSRNDKGACTDSQKVVDIGTGNRPQLKRAVAAYKPYGETPIGHALREAGQDLGGEGQRTVILVSDGEPTCQPDPCAVAAELAKAGVELKIEVVGLHVSGKARDMLKCVADKGNGSYYDADDAEDLTHALDKLATRALRPYKPAGKPITGAESEAAAPAITAGDWLDKLGGLDKARSELFYTLRRTIPGSTIHVSASIRTSADRDSLRLRIFSPDGVQCASTSDSQVGSSGPIIAASLAAPGTRDWDKSCSENDDFIIVITRGLDNRGGLFAGDDTVPVEIRVIEEPPVVSVNDLPKAQDTAELTKLSFADPEKITGGQSFAQATEVEDGGSYSGTLVPGEVQIFAVDLDWGQHLSASARTPVLSKRLSQEVRGKSVRLNLKTYSPSRARSNDVIKSRDGSVLSSSGSRIDAITAPVTYRHRESYTDTRQGTSQSGTYLIAVSLQVDDGKQYQVPFNLAIAVGGSVAGAPTYQQGESAPPSSPAPDPSTPAPNEPSADASSSSGEPPVGEANGAADGDRTEAAIGTGTVIGLSIGGVGIVAVIAGVIAFLMHRRSGA